MKNIEKFPRTKDAIEVWGKYHDGGGTLPFASWADQEVALPTLLEAAEKVKTTWESQWQYGSLSVVAKAIGHLADAIASEKRKPVRNCDKYRTVEEANSAFLIMCNGKDCMSCQFRRGRSMSSCRFVWLYTEAEKEAAK